jgi:hypothetical protein
MAEFRHFQAAKTEMVGKLGLIERFAEILAGQPLFVEMFGSI